MFSGIVENQARILSVRAAGSNVAIEVERPSEFDDIKTGDSICTNGVCLTVETFNDQTMKFSLGPETLKVTGWTVASLQNQMVNLERSLRVGDRVHGHMVSGHVDAIGKVVKASAVDGALFLDVEVPKAMLPFLWKKGSWAINGVSLTINSIESNVVGVCLIPETLKRTNLAALKLSQSVNLEVDMMARGMVEFLKTYRSETQEQNV